MDVATRRGRGIEPPLGRLPHAATNRLLGLSFALDRFKTDKIPLDGDLGRAKQYVGESIDYTYATQNSDGSWGRATGRDYAMAVSSTAHILAWLVTTLPAARLEDPQVVRGIDFLHSTFNSPHYQAYIATMNSAREISAAMHAAFVLNTYDRRVFVPADPLHAEPAKAEKPDAKSASRAVEPR